MKSPFDFLNSNKPIRYDWELAGPSTFNLPSLKIDENVDISLYVAGIDFYQGKGAISIMCKTTDKLVRLDQYTDKQKFNAEVKRLEDLGLQILREDLI